LVIASSRDFAKDRKSVYHRSCGGPVCVFEPVQGLDPATFQEVSTSTSYYGDLDYGEDANHLYVCENEGCAITPTIPASKPFLDSLRNSYLYN
jgi:hypothetical protein